MLTPITLPLQSNPGRYGADGTVRLINCAPEKRGAEGKIEFPLYATDGLASLSDLSGGGATRGMITVGSHLYTVSRSTIFKTTIGGESSVIAGFPGGSTAFMAQNLKSTPQIALVSGGKRAIIENDTLTTITDSDLATPSTVTFINQRFVFTVTNGRFQWSSISEGTEYDALDFATAEYGPDGLVRAFVRRGELLLFGERTIEPWYTPSSGDSVFLRSGSVIERGCASAATVALLEEAIVFVAEDGTVRVIEGYSARRISHHAVEMAIHDTADKATIVGFTYSKEGHSFYVLTADDFTWVYDAHTGLWHERKSYGLNRWRAQHSERLGDNIVMGDYSEGKLYTIDEDAFSEAGNNLVMTVQFPIHAWPRKVRLDELRVDMIPGVGTNSSDEHVANPQMMLEVSRDGGKTFGNQRTASIGRVGVYGKQTRFNRLGSSNEDGFVLRISVSAAVARAITGIAADTQILAN